MTEKQLLNGKQNKNTQNLSKEEVLRRLPEIEEIDIRKLREEVVCTFQEFAPDYFWEVPASSSGKYHPKDTVNKNGLWIHVKRSFQAFERLADSYVEQGLITEKEREYGKASILLHDLFKQGLPPRDEHHTSKDHDRVAARFFKNKTDLPNEVIRCVDSHNGAWNKGKTPQTELEQLHHLADMISSGRNVYIEMQKPVPEELKSKTIFESENLGDF